MDSPVRSELEVGRQHGRAGRAQRQARAAVVQHREVFLVEQVVDVQAQADLVVDLVAQHGVGHPVGGNVGHVLRCGVGAVDHALLFRHVARADAHRPLVQLVRGPQRQRQVGRPAHAVGDRGAVGAAALIDLLGAGLGQAGADLPEVGDLADRREFEALHARLAELLHGVGDGVGRGLLVVLDAKDRGRDVEALVEQIPLGAELDRLGLPWVQSGVVLVVVLRAQREVVAPGRGFRGGVGRVDAAVLGGLVRSAQAPALERARIVKRRREHAGRVVGARAQLVAVQAQASGERPLLVELHGVEGVQRDGVGGATGLGSRAWPELRHHVVGVRVVQVGESDSTGGGDGRMGEGRLLLVQQFHTGRQRVLQAARVELGVHAGLVGEDLVFLVYALARAADVPGQGVRQHRAVAGGGDGVDASERAVHVRLADARDVAHSGARAEVVFDLGGEHVGLDLLAVVHAAVVVLAIDLGGVSDGGSGVEEAFETNRRNAPIRHVLLADVLAVQVDARGRAQAGHVGQAQALAGVFHVVAAVHAAVLHHRVDADGGLVAELLVQVHGGALALGRAQGDGGAVLIAQVRLLGHQVQEAGRGAPAGLGASGALHDLDLLEVEGVACDGTQVADAVNEGGLLQREAAQLEGVAGGGVAVLTHLHGDARGVAQRFHQGDGALLLNDFLLDDLNRLGCVEQGRGELRVGRLVGLVRHLRRLFHRDGGQRVRRAGLRDADGGHGDGQQGEELGGRAGGAAVLACHVGSLRQW